MKKVIVEFEPEFIVAAFGFLLGASFGGVVAYLILS